MAQSVRMYPNPASGNQITLVHSTSEGDWTARIRDAQGRAVANHIGTGTQASIDVSDLPSGLYVMDVEALGWRQPLIRR